MGMCSNACAHDRDVLCDRGRSCAQAAVLLKERHCMTRCCKSHFRERQQPPLTGDEHSILTRDRSLCQLSSGCSMKASGSWFQVGARSSKLHSHSNVILIIFVIVHPRRYDIRIVPKGCWRNSDDKLTARAVQQWSCPCRLMDGLKLPGGSRVELP